MDVKCRKMWNHKGYHKQDSIKLINPYVFWDTERLWGIVAEIITILVRGISFTKYSICRDGSRGRVHPPPPQDDLGFLIQLIFCKIWKYSRTLLFRTRLIRNPRYFEGGSNALGFTLPLYTSPAISKPRYFELFFISLGTSKIAGFDCMYEFYSPQFTLCWWLVKCLLCIHF